MQQCSNQRIPGYAVLSEVFRFQSFWQTTRVGYFDPVIEYIHLDIGAPFKIVPMCYRINNGFPQYEFRYFQDLLPTRLFNFIGQVKKRTPALFNIRPDPFLSNTPRLINNSSVPITPEIPAR